jgi:hypothetical protein
MSERLVEVLSAAGWSPGRRVDVTAWVAEIRADGLEVSEVAQEFWASFGGLTVRRPGRYETVLELDPTEVTGYGDLPGRWRQRHGQVFSPIGVYNYSDGLWIGDQGLVMSEFGEEQDKRIASSPHAALEVLLFGKPPFWRRWGTGP